MDYWSPLYLSLLRTLFEYSIPVSLGVDGCHFREILPYISQYGVFRRFLRKVILLRDAIEIARRQRLSDPRETCGLRVRLFSCGRQFWVTPGGFRRLWAPPDGNLATADLYVVIEASKMGDSLCFWSGSGYWARVPGQGRICFHWPLCF